MVMRARDIKWDTDGKTVDLPTSIDLPENMSDEDEISDYLSDLTGFCHKGFELVELKQYVVSVAVDARAYIKVLADDTHEAKEKAVDEFMDFSCGDLEIVDTSPVNCEGPDGNLTDY